MISRLTWWARSQRFFIGSVINDLEPGHDVEDDAEDSVDRRGDDPDGDGDDDRDDAVGKFKAGGDVIFGGGVAEPAEHDIVHRGNDSENGHNVAPRERAGDGADDNVKGKEAVKAESGERVYAPDDCHKRVLTNEKFIEICLTRVL